METPRDSTLLVSSCVCVFIIFALIKIFHHLWWAPTRLQNQLGRGRIRGPSYRFTHGNTKEITAMQKEAMSRPMDLSDHNIFPRLHPHIQRWTNLYGKCYLQWDGCQAQLVVTEPDLVKEILTDTDGVYSKGKPKPFIRKLLGNGLATSNGEKWAKVRKLANYAFHAQSLKRMIPIMIESTEKMLERWKHKQGKEVEVYEDFRFVTSEVISKTAFGSSYVEGQKIFELLMKLVVLSSQNTYKRTLSNLSKVFKSRDEIEAERLEKEMYELMVELIKKIDGNGDEDGYGSDFLGLLMKAHHNTDERERILLDDIVDECKTFYFAGQETTNTLLAWTVLLLAIHDDWQEVARKEVLNLFGKQNPKPNDLAKLKIMSMIINETLRLYPPVVIMTRQVTRKVRLGNFDLPTNLRLFISFPSIHHDQQVWGKEVHDFKPERFSEGVANATKNNIGAFLPFGIGPRSCVGFNFAIAEAKVALAMILQRYTFTLSPTYVHSPVQVITSRPQYGVQVVLRSL